MTAEDYAAAERLRTAWYDFRAREKKTQMWLANEAGMSQGNVSHYLRGRFPIGVGPTIRLAAVLGIDPADIRPELRLRFERTEVDQARHTAENPLPYALEQVAERAAMKALEKMRQAPKKKSPPE